MLTKDLKQEIQKLMQEKNGITMFAVLKGEYEDNIRFINIADEQNDKGNTTEELYKGFTGALENRFLLYNDDEEVIKLSSADGRKDGVYYYDLDELPTEMDMLKRISERSETITAFNFTEDSLDKIAAFIIEIGNAGRKIVLYKQQYPISLLKRDRYMLTPIPHENRMKKVEQDILRVDFNYQFFLWNGIIYISDIDKMEKICSFHNIIVNEAKKSLRVIADMDILDNIEVLFDELDDTSFARKLTRVYKDSRVVGNVDNGVIIKFSQEHTYFKKNPLKLNGNRDKFILDTKKSKNTFLKLLNDDLLTSQLTNYDYESLAKNNT